VNAADGVEALFPDVSHWYIGGHSLGGSMAASYISKHTDDFSGLVLLGSYSTADLSGGAVDVLSLYGSEDGVMNKEKYEKYKKNLPTDLIEIKIDGGCHAYFGMYGEQDGDGTPTLSAEEQIRLSADSISKFVLGGEN
jgi:dienelactone hydrolase